MDMNSKTYRVKAGHLSLFLTIVYSDSRIENVLIKCGKTGSTIHTAMSLLGVFLSKALQSGYSVDRAVRHFRHIHSGSVLSNGQDLFDFIGQALEEVQRSLSLSSKPQEMKKENQPQLTTEEIISPIVSTEVICGVCKKPCIKSGSCYVCPNCGQTTGCSG